MRRRTDHAVFILGQGRGALTMLNRIRLAGCVPVGISANPDLARTEGEAERFTTLVAAVEPALLSRDLLHRCDQLGIRVLGVVANARQRDWAALLPLRETVWLFAPVQYYSRGVRGYARRRSGHIAS